MSSNVINRSVKRIAFGAFLRSALVGTGKPVQKVYDEPMVSFPEAVAVALESDGSERPDADIIDSTDSSFYINAHTFVIWRPGAEDTLDLIEKSIADVVKDNDAPSANWDSLKYIPKSQADIVEMGDNTYYRHEVIRVKIQVDD